VTTPDMSSVFAGFRFPREVISVAVRWYLRYGLSYRDVEELLAHAFAQNLRRGHYDIATDVPDHYLLRIAFDDVATTI
jgi:hypothetical protein